jgi:hypothetical protein
MRQKVSCLLSENRWLDIPRPLKECEMAVSMSFHAKLNLVHLRTAVAFPATRYSRPSR